ncbi:MAG: hypothetical protein ABSB59_31315 [Streptosporangiaceae bacterium]|jgi:enoyl-CoA hydratase/carnithine racemase
MSDSPAPECQAAGFVSRVFPAQDLERETRPFARRVAGNHPFTLRMTKPQISKARSPKTTSACAPLASARTAPGTRPDRQP